MPLSSADLTERFRAISMILQQQKASQNAGLKERAKLIGRFVALSQVYRRELNDAKTQLAQAKEFISTGAKINWGEARDTTAGPASVWVVLQVELIDIAVLATACESLLASITDKIQADCLQSLRDCLYTNSKPIKVKHQDLRHLYKALHSYTPNQDHGWLRESIRSRVVEMLRTAWASVTGTDDLHRVAFAD